MKKLLLSILIALPLHAATLIVPLPYIFCDARHSMATTPCWTHFADLWALQPPVGEWVTIELGDEFGPFSTNTPPPPPPPPPTCPDPTNPACTVTGKPVYDGDHPGAIPSDAMLKAAPYFYPVGKLKCIYPNPLSWTVTQFPGCGIYTAAGTIQ